MRVLFDFSDPPCVVWCFYSSKGQHHTISAGECTGFYFSFAVGVCMLLLCGFFVCVSVCVCVCVCLPQSLWWRGLLWWMALPSELPWVPIWNIFFLSTLVEMIRGLFPPGFTKTLQQPHRNTAVLAARQTIAKKAWLVLLCDKIILYWSPRGGKFGS